MYVLRTSKRTRKWRTSSKDALENDKVVALGPVIFSSWNNVEQRCGCPGGRPQTDCSQPVGGSDEVGKIVDSHCGRQ